MSYRRVAQLRNADILRTHLADLGIELPFDETMQTGDDAPLAQPLSVYGHHLGNRFAVLPMEGWDGSPDGQVRPSWCVGAGRTLARAEPS